MWGFGEGMFFNFVPIYLDRQFLLSESEIGWVLGMFGFSMAITHIPAGWLADRLGRRPLLIIAWMLGLVSTVVMGSALFLPLFLAGLFGYMTAARGKWSVSMALSLTSATFGMGMVLGPMTGGWIGDHYGMRTSFWVATVVFVLSNIFIFFIETQPIDHHDPDAPPSSLMDNRRFVILMSVLTFATFAMYLAQPLTPNFLEGVRGLSLSETGFVFTVGALGNSLMAILFSRFEPRRGFLFSQVFVGMFAYLMWIGTNLPIFALGYFLLGGFRSGRLMVMAQARELVHDSQMGMMYGVIETISAVIFILTPPLAGILFERNPVILYPLGISLIAVSILVSYFFMSRREVHA